MEISRSTAALLVCGMLAAGLAAPARAQERRTAGAVVSVERLARALWLPKAGSAKRFRYVTRDSRGKTAVSSGMLHLPKGRAPKGGWPVVAWAHGTVGIADACAPSRTGFAERDVRYLSRWLAEGYAIVATDYAGLGAEGVPAYADGPSEAENVADSVRAARKIVKSLARKWVVVGQSQGGHAALFTLHSAARYAPELDFRGGVATGAPSNIEYLAPFGGPYLPDLPLHGLTTYFAFLMASLRANRPDVEIDRFLTPRGRTVLADALRLCYADLSAKIAADGTGINDILARSLFDRRFFEAERAALAVPTEGYRRPFYLAHGARDTDIPAVLTLKLAADLRRAKAPVTFRLYPGADHSGNMFASLPDTVPFVRRLLRG
ncbi:alpha/beta hydrolase family protein [Actinocorallia sp. A-T 12471]|uniref:alpha/beta hydrolase family protein n=1 Tax=Actinocorallia sp. A-T 12471 TaxID=3089813 RepID=UPI0029CB574B|nr:lipase family protein [Actinocorallia sp. A-T 12471]MDX6739669.1 alpha/beta fold hydrolase [Actinocorallia sp. A-T 12471]